LLIVLALRGLRFIKITIKMILLSIRTHFTAENVHLRTAHILDPKSWPENVAPTFGEKEI
jgi:hypothetical protein